MICFDEKRSEVFTVEDLMEYLSIGKTTAYKLLRSDKIKTLKIGKLYRIPKKAVDDYINSVRK
ncbi:MAG: helix-turn-helix domain-containing protein [Selenomonadaceae bacterium]|nr:helix-turn-helix domain-containing protein [Selenomonadaceae bacterium]